MARKDSEPRYNPTGKCVRIVDVNEGTNVKVYRMNRWWTVVARVLGIRVTGQEDNPMVVTTSGEFGAGTAAEIIEE